MNAVERFISRPLLRPIVATASLISFLAMSQCHFYADYQGVTFGYKGAVILFWLPRLFNEEAVKSPFEAISLLAVGFFVLGLVITVAHAWSMARLKAEAWCSGITVGLATVFFASMETIKALAAAETGPRHHIENPLKGMREFAPDFDFGFYVMFSLLAMHLTLTILAVRASRRVGSAHVENPNAETSGESAVA